MTKNTRTILLVVGGVIICFAVVLVGTGFWLFASAIETAPADEMSALRSLEDVRARFKGTTPILEVRDGIPTLSRTSLGAATGGSLASMHILSWDQGDEQLSRVTLPFWLLRLTNGPFDLSGHTSLKTGNTQISVTVEEIERYGPALLLDHAAEDGTHVLVWTE